MKIAHEKAEAPTHVGALDVVVGGGECPEASRDGKTGSTRRVGPSNLLKMTC